MWGGKCPGWAPASLQSKVQPRWWGPQAWTPTRLTESWPSQRGMGLGLGLSSDGNPGTEVGTGGDGAGAHLSSREAVDGVLAAAQPSRRGARKSVLTSKPKKGHKRTVGGRPSSLGSG